MAKSPAFQFYASDFLTDTQSWDINEVGIYIRLLANQWVNGSVPSEHKRLARIAGCDFEDFEKAWVILGFKFLTNEEGNLYNAKLEDTRGQQKSFSTKQGLNGSKGGRPRKIKPNINPEETQIKANLNPQSNPNHNPNKSSSTSTSIKENIIKEFDFFWSKYPNKVAKEKCFNKFKALSDEDRLKIVKTVVAFGRYKPFETYTHPNPETYLNQKRWTDEVPDVKQMSMGYTPTGTN